LYASLFHESVSGQWHFCILVSLKVWCLQN